MEALLAIINLLDRSDAVDRRGRASFWQWIRKETEEQRNKYRHQIINTNKQQLQTFSKRLKDAGEAKKGAVTRMGPEAAAREFLESGEAMERIKINEYVIRHMH